MITLTGLFGEKLRYCGGNLTEDAEGVQRITLSPRLFDVARRELRWTQPVRRVDEMTMQEVDLFTFVINTLAP